MEVLVTYDVSTPDRDGQRRLAKVAAVCERYGERVQYSVFACRVSNIALFHLIAELESVIDAAADRIDLYRVPGTLAECRTSLGRGVDRDPGQPWFL